ncbi:carbohydrate binding domain-containing protein [Flavobacterium sp. SUN052]|uniref:carbohydrate binding domain-containing protein n=1 Tax=Flavobacterium sp. SUN052 TaxID=3002441 RepID=UPI00237ED2E1|nr:carbohydrate binding domain-containing protein [Flavobacterium sp. SUN052]MEC4005479.1 carbohydrate binding domain-containing protein [Flavobacterium sp. SUN052]
MKNIIALILLVLSLQSYAQKNLIANGGFETNLNNWRGDAATLSPYDRKSGNSSCTITQFTGADWKGIDQIISIPKNTVAIEFSAWIKSDAIEEGKNKWNTGKYDVEFLNAGEKNVSNESVAAITGTTTWTFYKKVITIPVSASKFRVMLALGQTNGTILFDDVKATTLNQNQVNKILEEENAKRSPAVISGNFESKPTEFSNGNFENGITSWRGNATVSTTIFKEGKAALVLNSSTFDWTGIDQIAEVPENVSSITISGWLKSDNIKQGKEIWNNGLLNVEFTGNDNQKTGDDQSVTFVTATTDWTFYTKTFLIPKGTKKYRIMLALGFASGILYADDVAVSFK